MRARSNRTVHCSTLWHNFLASDVPLSLSWSSAPSSAKHSRSCGAPDLQEQLNHMRAEAAAVVVTGGETLHQKLAQNFVSAALRLHALKQQCCKEKTASLKMKRRVNVRKIERVHQNFFFLLFSLLIPPSLFFFFSLLFFLSFAREEARDIPSWFLCCLTRLSYFRFNSSRSLTSWREPTPTGDDEDDNPMMMMMMIP